MENTKTTEEIEFKPTFKLYYVFSLAIPLFFIIFDPFIQSLSTRIILTFIFLYSTLRLFSIPELPKFSLNMKSIKKEQLEIYLGILFIGISITSTLLFVDMVNLISYTQYLYITVLANLLLLIHFSGSGGFQSRRGKNIFLAGSFLQLYIQMFNIIASNEINFTKHNFLLLPSLLIFLIFHNELRNIGNWQFYEKIGILLLIVTFLIFDIAYLDLSENAQGVFFQSFKDVLVNSSTLILISAGLTLTTRVRKFGNFAHAEFITVGLYITVLIGDFGTGTGFLQPVMKIIYDNIFLLLIITFILTGLVGVIGELLIFSPLEKRKATPLTLMVGSIGFGLILRQLIQEIWGGSDQNPISPSYPEIFTNISEFIEGSIFFEICGILGLIIGSVYGYYKLKTPIDRTFAVVIGIISGYATGFITFLAVTEVYDFSLGTLDIFGLKIKFFDTIILRVEQDQIWAILIMVISVTILRLMFTKTTLGMSMRATADDPDLAQITGINTHAVIIWTWIIAAGITGVGALYKFASASFLPASGFILLLMVFAVAILGGFDSFEGTLVAGFIVEGVRTVTSLMNSELARWETTDSDIDTLVFWSAGKDWTTIVPFGIIIVVLLYRPRGIFGLVDPKSKL